MEIQEISFGSSLYTPTPQEFLEKNPDVAERMADDLVRFARYAPHVFGLNSEFYNKMNEFNPVAAVIYASEQISLVIQTREEYRACLGVIYASATRALRESEKQIWDTWLTHMQRDDYGMILLGHEKWINK